MQMASGSKLKEALEEPIEEELSTDDELDALADQYDKQLEKQQTRSQPKSSYEDDTDDTLPPLDESDDSLSGDAAGGDAGEDDETDDAALRQKLADAYGLDVGQLAGFTSAKDAEAVLALLDAQFSAAARQGYRQQWEQQPPPPQPQPPMQQQAAAQQQIAAQLAEIELLLDDLDKDDPLHKNFSAIKGAINPMVREVQFLREAVVAMYRETAQREQLQREQTFHATLDRVNPRLFGTAEKSTPLQRRYRERLIEEYNDIEIAAFNRAQRLGTAVPPMEKLIEKAMRSAFANQLAKDNRTQQQTNGRPRPRLGTPGRGRSRKEGDRAIDFDGEIEDNPVLHRLFKQMEEANGSAG